MEPNKNDNEVLSNFVETEYEDTNVHEPVADELERKHFQKIVNAFKFYRLQCHLLSLILCYSCWNVICHKTQARYAALIPVKDNIRFIISLKPPKVCRRKCLSEKR